MKSFSILLKFIVIFLTVNHLQSTFASPIVSEDTIDDGQLLELTDTVATQAEAVAPPGQLCDRPLQWRSRRCIASQLDRAWVDRCRRPGENHWYYRFGSCPADKMCINTLFRRVQHGQSFLTRNIYCLGRPKTRIEKPVALIKVPSGQVGVIPINTFDQVFKNPDISVVVESTIGNASITALIEGTYQTSKLIAI